MLIMYVKLAEAGGVSKRTLLKMLVDQGFLPKDFDIDAELQIVGERFDAKSGGSPN
jgi:hypothetical protein